MKTDTCVYILREILKNFPEQAKIAFAGGCIRDMLVGDKVKDYDVFCQDKESEELIIKHLQGCGAKELNINDALANFILDGKLIQVIRGKYYNLESTQLIDSFDYTICCAMVTRTNFFVHPNFYETVLTKHLRINKITFPLSTFERLQKYITKGYFACNGTLLEIAKSLQSIKISDDPEENKSNSLLFYPDGTPRFLGVD